MYNEGDCKFNNLELSPLVIVYFSVGEPNLRTRRFPQRTSRVVHAISSDMISK